MSRQLFINNATAVPAAAAGVNGPDEVAEARVAAFNPDDYASGTLDLTAPYEGDQIEFVQGAKTDEDPIRTALINMEDVVAVDETPYTAPVSQVTTVTPVTGTGTATVRVVQVNTGFKPHKRVTIDVILDGKTAEEIVDDFVEQFNKNYPQFVTASNASNELVLTGDTGVSFETSTDQEAAGWDVVATTTPNFGSGTYEHIKNLEEFAFGGNYPNRIYLPVEPPRYAERNATYDLFTIKVKTNTTRNIGGNAQKYQEIRIAVHATATGIDLPVFFGFEEPAA